MKNNGIFSLLLLLLIVGLADCGAWAIFLGNFALSLGQFLLLRACLGGFLFLLVKYRLPRETLNPNLAGVVTVVFFYPFGILGLTGMGLIFVMAFRQALQTGVLYHIDQEEGEILPAFESAGIRVNIEELRKVAPLADGMTDEEKNVRTATILAMEEVEAASIRNILKASRNDRSKEVQYYAHEALKKIIEAYTKKIKTLLDVLNVTAEPDYSTYKELADLYAQFAEANIEHPVLIKFYHQEAVKYYSFLVENYPQQRTEILEKFIPALYHNKEYARCADYCAELQQDPKLASLGILYHARCLFAARKLPALKHFAATVKGTELQPFADFLAMREE